MSAPKKENCFFCEKDRTCPYTVMVGKEPYAMCRLCAVEAKKDGYQWVARK